MPGFEEHLQRFLTTPLGEAAYDAVEALETAGEEAWLVGGGVRDLLLGKIPDDVDIATSALPGRIKEIFPKHGSTLLRFRASHFALRASRDRSDGQASSPQAPGEAYGSLFIKHKNHTLHITTFREDDEASDGRHPESVVFGSRDADAARRDFTVNAIYAHPIRREIFDPFDGRKDARDTLIRFIGAPATRIRHDALRLLRAVRFRAKLSFQYEPETYIALKENVSMLEALSLWRVREELERMLMEPGARQAIEDLHELTVLDRLLPELDALKGLAQPADYHREGDCFEHVLKIAASFRSEDGIDVRVAAVLHDIGKAKTFSRDDKRIRFDDHAEVSATMAGDILQRLQYPKERRDKIIWLVGHHMMLGPTLDMPEKRQAHWYFHPWFAELLRLFYLDIAGTSPSDFRLYEKVENHYHHFLDSHPRPEKPLLTGEEVMGILGIGPGERVGEMLAKLHEAQLQKKITTKREAEEFVKQWGGRG